jgi:hypothetical protein
MPPCRSDSVAVVRRGRHIPQAESWGLLDSVVRPDLAIALSAPHLLAIRPVRLLARVCQTSSKTDSISLSAAASTPRLLVLILQYASSTRD